MPTVQSAGVRIQFEVQGDGAPIVLVHGCALQRSERGVPNAQLEILPGENHLCAVAAPGHKNAVKQFLVAQNVATRTEILRQIIRRLRGQPRLLPRGVEVDVEDVEYQPGLLARVYRPRATTPFAALLDVHGGNWTSENRLQMRLLDAALARLR